MAIITLLTDFGLEDAYVSIVKGVILSVNPSATIVDITHAVAPQDLIRASYLLETAYGYFAPGTVHMVVVDPGVGSERAIVAVEAGGHRFLAPDNGVLTAVLAERAADRAVRVENRRLFLEPVSRTFHGRDIFAPVAGHLSMGLDLEDLGPTVEPGTLVCLHLPQPVITDGHEIAGVVVAVDRFGNLMTNIRDRDLLRLSEQTGSPGFSVQICGQTCLGLSNSYSSVAPGEPLAIMGSAGRLEISVNGGSAQTFYETGTGEKVLVRQCPH